ncbi:MAG: ribonuclease III [Victivallales bacterium]|nr:ribonuclease III [Victivallales bacterium]
MKKINLPESNSPTILEQIQQNAGYRFKDIELLNMSVTHASYAMEHNIPLHDYQRLEFLGDAVLQIIVSDYIFKKLPDEQEGILTRLRSMFANEQATASYSIRLGLDMALLLGRGEQLSGGRTRSSILGDIFEAFLAAIYLDGGIEPARALVMRLLPPLDSCMEKLAYDENPKGALQIYCQAHFKSNTTYRIVNQTGPNHAPIYVVDAMLNDKVIGTGEGHSHKEAARNAAHDALIKLKQIPEDEPHANVSVQGETVKEDTSSSKQPKSRPTKRILALDFDGVICDSAAETAASAWHVAHTLWPTQFVLPDIPSDMTEKFRAARPYLETGFQAIIMLKILMDGNPVDFFKENFAAKIEDVMASCHLTKPELVKAFGNARDQWISSDLDGWLSLHGLYPGTIKALKTALTNHKVLILTTKQERFVSAILKQQGIDFPETCIYGLDRKISKETELATLVGAKKTNIHFVEDRIETLLKIKANPVLKRVKLHYAPWGYGTSEQLEIAKADSKIDILSLETFAELLG